LLLHRESRTGSFGREQRCFQRCLVPLEQSNFAAGRFERALQRESTFEAILECRAGTRINRSQGLRRQRELPFGLLELNRGLAPQAIDMDPKAHAPCGAFGD
jgi:hypothetical protein